MNHDPELVDKIAEAICNHEWGADNRWSTYQSCLTGGLPYTKEYAQYQIAYYRGMAIVALDVAVPEIERRAKQEALSKVLDALSDCRASLYPPNADTI